MQVGEGSTAPVVVEQVLQMKSLQFPKLVLMPEQWMCTQLWQLRQMIEFAPTPSYIHCTGM